MIFNQSSMLFASLTLIMPVLQECDLDLDVDTDVDVDVETDDGDVDVDVEIDVDVDIDVTPDGDGGADGGNDYPPPPPPPPPTCEGDEYKTTPIKDLKDLKKIIVYERTGGTEPDAYKYELDNPADLMLLKERLDGTLSAANNDHFATSAGEYCDVFFSDAWGNPEPWGSYLSIECVYNGEGTGMNIAEVKLVYSSQQPEFAKEVVDFVSGPGYVQDSEKLAADKNLQTHSSMGRTTGMDAPDRLRLTFSFESALEPKCDYVP